MNNAIVQQIQNHIETLPAPLAENVRQRFEDYRSRVDGLPAAGDWCESLPVVWGASDFVSQSMLRYPDLLADLVNSGDLTRPHQTGQLRSRLLSKFGSPMDEATLKQRLRLSRRREMVCIAWRDLAGWASLNEVLAMLTELADTYISIALGQLHNRLSQELGVPVGRDSGQSVGLVVLALGKLGGSELNFSSDIDLVFAYPEEGETVGGIRRGRQLTNQEYFIKLGQHLIQVLGEITEDGFVFRVDMRLRPNGDSGPLALSFDAMEHYYQTHGREWERYALIKARISADDTNAGEDLLNRLKPFVYRRYLDYGVIDSLRDMKAMINRELQRKGMTENIKLGPGGIREIEFMVQTFQLIRGGREPTIQQNNFTKTLSSLGGQQMMTEQAIEQLKAGYDFLRRTEHRLQMVADRQTQTLPPPGPERERLAFAMGYADSESFDQALAHISRTVHEQFEQIFVAPQAQTDEASRNPLHDLWLGTLDEGLAQTILASVGYQDPAAAWNLLRGLRGVRFYSVLSSAGRDRMDRLIPLLLAAAGLCADPLSTLSRVIGVLEAIGGRTVYLALLVENPLALSQLIKLCSASAWIAQWISRHPILLDELINPRLLYRPLELTQLDDELRQWLARLPQDDLEAQMDALREFRHSHVLRVAAADVSEVVDATYVGRALCAIAEVVLGHALNMAYGGLVETYGEPSGVDQGTGMVVIAYGKLGSLEMGYTSDLDLVFVCDDKTVGGQTCGPKTIGNEVFYARLGQRLLHIVGARTVAGVLYEVDVRLRPNGQSGPLVTNQSALRRYQQEKAWTWEHQAMVRARPVAGDPKLGEQFMGLRRDILCLTRDPQELAAAVVDMRNKIVVEQMASPPKFFHVKQDRGGIVDIEFIVQYCVLRWAKGRPGVTRHTDNVGILEDLADAGLLEQTPKQALVDAYRHYLSIEHRLKLTEQPPWVGEDELVAQRQKVMEVWKSLLGSPVTSEK
ncbi:MAG TPA: bifunctional [glutamate--ammonia ligase]-adenylyl-L-tyrosine phosphorylase/[glutamate--ammonia-ligase] adenylyltransferase [Acidiferrobacteraceae bacterium]|nr:bifunctional [glutamate--ammonia ligase]-adenylyl-L-tyrosine phosphorylase/[glutamate--ammonia-ligase] adenylyltransferase [Acidiferrobacteraceae bacterium]